MCECICVSVCVSVCHVFLHVLAVCCVGMICVTACVNIRPKLSLTGEGNSQVAIRRGE